MYQDDDKHLFRLVAVAVGFLVIFWGYRMSEETAQMTAICDVGAQAAPADADIIY